MIESKIIPLSRLVIVFRICKHFSIIFQQRTKLNFLLDGEMESGIISSGYLVVTYKNMKGYVCADDWHQNNIRVACGHLGFPEGEKYQALMSNGLIILNGLNCDGTESSLLSCDHTGFADHRQECKSNTAVWLKCKLFNRTARFKNVSS